MGWALFMFSALFIFYFFIFFFVLSVTRPKLPLSQIFNSCNLWCLFTKSSWNINTRTMLRTLFFLLCVKYIFFWFYQSIGFKGNNKSTKKVIMSAMECADVAALSFATWQKRWCLLCKFILPGGTVFLVFQVFFVFWDKRSELPCCFIEASSEIRRKIKYLQAKQRTCQNMQGLHHW